jgi:hypothetical protein
MSMGLRGGSEGLESHLEFVITVCTVVQSSAMAIMPGSGEGMYRPMYDVPAYLL